MYPFQVTPTRTETKEILENKGISPLLAAVLSARGVETAEEAKGIIQPNCQQTHSPFLLKDMDKAVARLKKAVEKGEKIAIYGDYDVDGITSTSLLTHCLRAQGADVLPYIPHRMGEGYGLHEVSLEDLFRKGIRLVVTVDCGISGKDQVDFANALGMDIIITDHHRCPQELPQALAIINPRIEPYPFPFLAGVGVALKLAQALAPEEEWDLVFRRYSDLVAVGTVADVMPMEGENRYFVREGLIKLNENPTLAFSALLEETGGFSRLVTAGTIGFTIAPRINAAGRLDQTQIALDLLLTSDPEEAKELVSQLCKLNTLRQQIEGEIYQACLEELEENPPEDLVFLSNDQWHPGVVGIVASRLGERYKMPAIMICCRDGVGKGSCRTVNNKNLYDVLSSCSDLLLGFGGHAQAAGFTIARENIPALYQQLKQAVREEMSQKQQNLIHLDARATVPQLTLEEVKALAQLEPCGVGCLRPSFLLEGAEVVGASLVGSGKHLRLRLVQNGNEIGGIFFHYTGEPVYIGAFLDIAFYLQENDHRGEVTPQLRIISMTLSQETDGFYQRWKRGGQITPQEASHLCPNLEEFDALLDYFKEIQGDSPFLLKEPNLSQLCQRLEEGANLPFSHGEVCLAVLRERGKVEIQNKKGETALYLKNNPEMPPLEQSPIFLYLSGEQL